MKRKIALLLTMALGVSCLAGCNAGTAEKAHPLLQAKKKM